MRLRVVHQLPPLPSIWSTSLAKFTKKQEKKEENFFDKNLGFIA